MDVDDVPAAGEAWTFPRYGSGASSGRAPRVIDDDDDDARYRVDADEDEDDRYHADVSASDSDGETSDGSSAGGGRARGWECVCSCGEVFRSARAYEEHYAVMHAHQCSWCSRAFTSARLLAIHVQERHDAFFAAKLARGDAVLECLADGCAQRFSTRNARRRHLVEVHAFPDNFAVPGIEDKPTRDVRGGGGGARRAGRPTMGVDGGGNDVPRLRGSPGMLPQRSEVDAKAPRGESGVAMDVDELSEAMARKLRMPLGFGAARTSKRGGPRCRLEI